MFINNLKYFIKSYYKSKLNSEIIYIFIYENFTNLYFLVVYITLFFYIVI
jgi:hypothetical protein